MGVKGGEPVPMELNSMLPQIVNTGCEAFEAQWKDFSVERVLDLDSSWARCLLPSMTSERANVSLVSNACYSMLMKLEEEGANYQPVLRISSRLYEDDNLVEVRVRDNGTGIPDDVVGHIFNPFFSTSYLGTRRRIRVAHCRRCSQTIRRAPYRGHRVWRVCRVHDGNSSSGF